MLGFVLAKAVKLLEDLFDPSRPDFKLLQSCSRVDFTLGLVKPTLKYDFFGVSTECLGAWDGGTKRTVFWLVEAQMSSDSV